MKDEDTKFLQRATVRCDDCGEDYAPTDPAQAACINDNEKQEFVCAQCALERVSGGPLPDELLAVGIKCRHCGKDMGTRFSGSWEMGHWTCAECDTSPGPIGSPTNSEFPFLLHTTSNLFCALVEHEVTTARAQHGQQMCSHHHGYAVILEEVEELWDQVKLKAARRDPSNILLELVQIAAMCKRVAEELVYPPGAVVDCGNCEWSGPVENGFMVLDIPERVDGDGIKNPPVVECPKCSALCYRRAPQVAPND